MVPLDVFTIRPRRIEACLLAIVRPLPFDLDLAEVRVDGVRRLYQLAQRLTGYLALIRILDRDDVGVDVGLHLRILEREVGVLHRAVD